MSFLSPKIGIDLGTSNTLVFVQGKGVSLNEPSVVAIAEGESKVLAVGLQAKEMIGRTPESIVAYRPLKDGVIADYRVTEIMLRYYIKKVIGNWNPFKPEVMISVPAGITSTERRAVIEAALKAGAGNVYVVKEPILAAIGAEIPIQEPGGHIIVDIGGGTTDVAVISLGGVVTSTSIKCAGDRIDDAIVRHIRRKFNLSIGEKTAEEIKVKIGTAKNLKEELVMEVKGSDYVTSLPKTVTVRSNEIATAVESELDEIIKAIKDVLQGTPPELAADIIDKGIVMTGGSSLLRKLPELVSEKIGVKAQTAKDALFCVAKGTGAALDHLNIYKKSIIAKR